MAGEIYAFRVIGLALLDADGGAIGRIDDIVLVPSPGDGPPQVIGFVAASQRRRIFVGIGAVAGIDTDGVRLRSSLVDVKPFRARPGELLVRKDLLDRRLGAETVSDVALRRATDGSGDWEVVRLMLTSRAGLRRRRQSRLVDWSEVAGHFVPTNPMAAEAARLRDLDPFDVANRVRNLPLHQRRQLAEAMEDDTLADLLEELPEAEQLRLIETLDLDRVVDVLEEMESDDATDLLAEMPGEQRDRVLEAMGEEDAAFYRRLLAYAEGTAGSLLTPDAVILGPTATVAEALARIRDEEVPVPLATQVFVTQPPFVPPTGAYLGVVHFQRLLREPPGTELARCLEPEPSIPPDLPDREVAERLAAYNLMAVAVCDAEHRLLGVVTVDDVLDRTLPVGWRQRRREGLREA